MHTHVVRAVLGTYRKIRVTILVQTNGYRNRSSFRAVLARMHLGINRINHRGPARIAIYVVLQTMLPQVANAHTLIAAGQRGVVVEEWTWHMVLGTLARMFKCCSTVHFYVARTAATRQMEFGHEKNQIPVDDFLFPQLSAALRTLCIWHVLKIDTASTAHRVNIATYNHRGHVGICFIRKQLHANLAPVARSFPRIRVTHYTTLSTRENFYL